MERWTGDRVGSREMRRKGVRSGGSDEGEARGSVRRSRRDGGARVEVVGIVRGGVGRPGAGIRGQLTVDGGDAQGRDGERREEASICCSPSAATPFLPRRVERLDSRLCRLLQCQQSRTLPSQPDGVSLLVFEELGSDLSNLQCR
jgi:hypothetical protein